MYSRSTPEPAVTPAPESTQPDHVQLPHPTPDTEPKSFRIRSFKPAPFYPIAASHQKILSDQIHVLGIDVQGRFITHALACCESLPPVRFLTHRKAVEQWYSKGGSRLLLHNGEEDIVTTRAIVERVDRLNKQSLKRIDRVKPVTNIGSTETGGFISNLIVTVPAESVTRSVASILHRIHARTTICLVQNGLGVAEALNEACFPNPKDQPIYVLGHMSHALGKTHDDLFAVSEVRQGKLYMTAMGHNLTPSEIKYHPPIERTSRVSHFLNMMSTVPRLQAGGYALEKFMAKKLHDTIIESVLEPLTVILECDFGKLAENTYARQMIDQLLGEILSVVMKMPELRGSTDIRWMVRHGDTRRGVYRRLARLKAGKSRMLSQTQRGFSSDIDFLNGYFVKRGREVGVRCPVNESVIWMVKAKHQEYLNKARAEIELQPL